MQVVIYSVEDSFADLSDFRLQRVYQTAILIVFKVLQILSTELHPLASVTDMLGTLGWKTLEQRRKEARLKMMYKISHNLVDFNTDMYLKPHPELRTCGSHALKYQIPMATKDVYKYSYFPRTVSEWNKLPSEVVFSNSSEQFQTKLTSFF